MDTVSRFIPALQKMAIIAVMALSVMGALPASTAYAQVAKPAGWPTAEPVPPLTAAADSSVALTFDEYNYYTNAANSARVAGVLTQAEYDAWARATERAYSQCTGEACPLLWKADRNAYIALVLKNAAGNVPFMPGTPTSPDGTFEVDDTDLRDIAGTPGVTTAEDPPLKEDCSLVSGNLLNCALSSVAKFIAIILWALVSMFAWMLGIVGMFFNWVMLVTVFQYGLYFGNSEGILLAWSILRDLGNIMLLFGFIFIGLQTILNIGHFSVGKALPRLVIFAILINFSLFVSSAVVDVSNVFASTFYNLASEGDCTEAANNAECVGYGISGKVLQAAGITDVFSTKGAAAIGTILAGDGFQQMMLYAGYSIFLLVLMVTLGAAAIMFVIRAITLMLLLVMSPLGFAGMALPQFEEQAGKWWKMLISQSFFAPIYLLFVLIGLKIMDGANATFNAGGANMLTALGETNVSAGGVFVIFALMTGFMIAAMQLAKSMGAVGASFAVNSASKTVGAATAGTLGFVGRRTLGETASRIGHAVEGSTWAQNNRGAARLVLGATDAASKATFDARGAGMVKGAAKAGGMDLGSVGKGASHGIHGIHDKAKKEREDHDKRMEKSASQKAVGDEAQTAIEGIEAKKTATLAGKRKEITDLAQKIADKRKKGVSDALLLADQNQLSALEREYKDQEGTFLEDKSGHLQRDDKGRVQNLTNREALKMYKDRQKQWNKKGEEEKTQNMIASYEKSAHNPWMAATAGPHADHVAAARLRKDAGLDQMAKALKGMKEAIGDAADKTAGATNAASESERKRDNAAADDHAHDDHSHAK